MKSRVCVQVSGWASRMVSHHFELRIIVQGSCPNASYASGGAPTYLPDCNHDENRETSRQNTADDQTFSCVAIWGLYRTTNQKIVPFKGCARAEQVENTRTRGRRHTGSSFTMVAVASGTSTWIGRNLKLRSPFSCRLRLLVCLGLVFSLFLAAMDIVPSGGDHRSEASIELSSDVQSDAIVCDDGVICAAYILPVRFGAAVSDLRYQIKVASSERAFVQFMTPQVDLPPPRRLT